MAADDPANDYGDCADPDLEPDETPDADDAELKHERSAALQLIGTILEQVVYIGDQTTRRLYWSHIMRLFRAVNLIDTKLGTQPSAGDFHTQMKLGSCIYQSIDDKKSAGEEGTFRNAEVAINRNNSMGKKWSAAYDANRRMVLDYKNALTVGFALERYGMKSPSDPPTKNCPPKNFQTLLPEAQTAWFRKEMNSLVKDLFAFEHAWTEQKTPMSHTQGVALATKTVQAKRLVHWCPKGCGKNFKLLKTKDMDKHKKECKYEGQSKTPNWAHEVKRPDKVFAYTKRAWNEAMLFEAYEDFIRFGNGLKMVEIQSKWMVPVTFNHSSRSHYTYEGLFTGAMTRFLLSPRMAHKLFWNRVCCGHDRAGENQPCDHRLENVNRTAKALLDHLGHQNMSTVDINALGKSVLPLHDACLHFDRVSRVARASAYCNTRQRINEEDEATILQICQGAHVFQEYPPQFPLGRAHRAFEEIEANPFATVDEDKLRIRVLRWKNKFARMQRSIIRRLYPYV